MPSDIASVKPRVIRAPETRFVSPPVSLRGRALRLSALMLVAALLTPTVVPLRAQQTGDPVFGETIDVRVINVEVVVTDKDGNPVLGLGPEDFRLRVDGEEIPIDYFSEIRGGVAVEAAPAGEGAAAAPGGLPTISPGQPVPTSYLLFIDDYFSIVRDRNQVLDNLMDQLPLLGPQDRMAVVAFDGGQIEMLSSWSQSTRDLRRTLGDAKVRKAYGLNRFGELRFFETVDDLADAFRRPFELTFQERQYAQELAQQVQRVVLAAASTLRGFAAPPGRKVMILLSGGWPFSPSEYAANDPGLAILDPTVPRGEELYEPLTRTANLLGYTIYTVDTPGLAADSQADAGLGDVTVTQGQLDLREDLDEETLQFVAAETGGRALINGSRLAAFEGAVQDTRTYYWLGFDSRRQGDDREHDIKVDVPSKGLRVRTRESFRDLSRKQEVDLAVESALLFGAPPGYDNLPIGTGEPKKAGRRFVLLPVQVAIPVDQVTFVPQGGKWRSKVELRIAVVSEDGDQSDIPVIPLDFELDEKPDPKQYIPYQTTVRLRNQRQRVIVALYDLIGNSLQSNTVDVRPVVEKKKR